jgi:hypothetical protein
MVNRVTVVFAKNSTIRDVRLRLIAARVTALAKGRVVME